MKGNKDGHYTAEDIGDKMTEERYTVWSVNEITGETTLLLETLTVEEASAHANKLKKDFPVFLARSETTYTVVSRYEKDS